MEYSFKLTLQTVALISCTVLTVVFVIRLRAQLRRPWFQGGQTAGTDSLLFNCGLSERDNSFLKHTESW